VNETALIIHAEDLGPRVLGEAAPDAGASALAEAVRRFLAEHQPWVAERVDVTPGEHCCRVTARAALACARHGERPIDLLRAAQGALGMADKLPEVVDEPDLPELDVDAAVLELPVGPAQGAAGPPEEILRSKVRYFPLPEAEWFEICAGQLVLTSQGICFEPRYRPRESKDQRRARSHAIPLAQVTQAARDTWFHLPCLRVSTRRGAYRYGWPPEREELSTHFHVDQWLEALSSLGAEVDRES